MLPTLTRAIRGSSWSPPPIRARRRRARFAADFGGRVYASVEALCADAEVDVVYVATPHQFHAEHVEAAAAARQARAGRKADGDHARRMPPHDRCGGARRRPPDRRPQPQLRRADPARARDHRERRAGRRADDQCAVLHRFPVSAAPRRKSWSRRAAAARSSARPRTRSTSCACSAAGACTACAPRPAPGIRRGRPRARTRRCSTFDGGSYRVAGRTAATRISTATSFAAASAKWAAVKDAARLRRRAPEAAPTPLIAGEELALKNARNYGGADYVEARRCREPARLAPAFRPGAGLLRARRSAPAAERRDDLRRRARGTSSRCRKPRVPRAEVIDELYAAVVYGRAPLHDGRWAMATLEVCLAMLRSARERARCRARPSSRPAVVTGVRPRARSATLAVKRGAGASERGRPVRRRKRRHRYAAPAQALA